LPKILRFVPGKAQDLRAWFLTMQYWLGGSDDNVEQMVRYLISRYSSAAGWNGTDALPPVEYPETGLYHPRLKDRITTDVSKLPRPANAKVTVGLLLMRSYVLASDTAHYDAVIADFEDRGIAVIPAFAGGLDGRPAIDAYFKANGTTCIDTLVSLTGFSLIGGPPTMTARLRLMCFRASTCPMLLRIRWSSRHCSSGRNRLAGLDRSKPPC
jgi:magnesium chelatase subunit H